MNTSSWLVKAATVFSVVGHPLCLSFCITAFLAWKYLPAGQAVWVCGLLAGGVVVPVYWHTHRLTKRGTYTNADVSNRQERYRLYPRVIGLLTFVTIALFATNQSRVLCLGMLSALLLVICAYGVNFFNKVSLHTSVALFMAWVVWSSNKPVGMAAIALALLIAASRLVLQRHTWSEVILGMALGTLTGALFYGLTGW
ncbi:hypothetical protein M0L20_19490 [Spirosoma sp. RP8]|uniref:Phosphatidic acid phosphatase type 2/haloperoxidase domain-containing protein n=1 Tax=Spirosoma liriopis TaxID=2937440 RepID=A0ABT0HPG4_9BACT|nr:phosphatase PAP2 family protein [Spirosoma liriopis]MCK8494059.1 hypothetical protein [Spirosoma liriopis]